ncbi:gag-pol polyprotein [Tanacetum coccineum]|uniref:Gag-pol polyprotein n=1 Tax=Tanacetum coccineum TaxID=301880 RepID=A0ABQ5F6W1_9ASTR
MSFLTSIYSLGNIMDEVDIEDLTIEQYLELTQNHAPSVGIKVDDMTITEYLEYEETIKTQDHDEYQPHSAKADIPTKYRNHLSPRHKSPDPPLDAKTNPYFQASPSPIHPKIIKTPRKYTRENEEQSDQGLARDDALRNWEARTDQLRRQEHEVSECKMVHTPKNDVHQKEISQIERISSLPEKPNPGSLTIPCSVDIFNINAIADLGASVNIMFTQSLEPGPQRKSSSFHRATPRAALFQRPDLVYKSLGAFRLCRPQTPRRGASLFDLIVGGSLPCFAEPTHYRVTYPDPLKGASLSVLFESILEELSFADPKNANIIVEMADKTSKRMNFIRGSYVLFSNIAIVRRTITQRGNIMDEVDIEDLTIEQYLELTQNHAPSASPSPIHPKIIKTPRKYTRENEEQSDQGLGDWFEAELEKCWKIQQRRDNSHLNLRRQARDDALRNWEARTDQLRRQEHEVSECKMVHTPKNDVHQKEISQIERISSLPEKPNPGSLTIPCLVDIFNINAIADLGASVNIMFESILEELSFADPKNANIIVEMADKTRCVSQGIIENVLVKIVKFSFTIDFVILDTKGLNNKTIILGRPFLAIIRAEINVSTREVSLGIKEDRVKIKMKEQECNFTTAVSEHLNEQPTSQDELSYRADSKTHWCKPVRQEHEKGLSYMNWVRARYGNVNDITKERILQNFWNNKLGGQTREKTITEEQEDPERCGETKIKAIIGAMVNKLPKEWFSGVSRDMDDLEGIIDYLEPTLYDGFIDHNDEAYKQRKNRLLGMPYTEPPPIIKEEAEITKYNLGAGEIYIIFRCYPDLGVLQPKANKSYAPPLKQSSSTRSQESTKYKGKEMAKPITPPSESASEEDKQDDWLEDTDEEIDEQELEAHYSYMEKIQEVPTADPGTDTEPLEKVDSNVIPDSSDMCGNDIHTDQNAKECDDERAALANLIANLTLDTEENKKILKQLKKANTSLT